MPFMRSRSTRTSLPVSSMPRTGKRGEASTPSITCSTSWRTPIPRITGISSAISSGTRTQCRLRAAIEGEHPTILEHDLEKLAPPEDPPYTPAQGMPEFPSQRRADASLCYCAIPCRVESRAALGQTGRVVHGRSLMVRSKICGHSAFSETDECPYWRNANAARKTS